MDTRRFVLWIVALVLAGLLAAPANAAARKRGPDLVVAKLAEPPAAARPGDSISIAVKVANLGRKAAKRSGVAFFLSPGARKRSDARRLTGSVALKAIKSRKKKGATARLTVPAGTPARAYRLIACADPRKKVRETNERNNCRASKRSLAVTRLGSVTPVTPGGPAPGGPGPGPTPTPTPVPGPGEPTPLERGGVSSLADSTTFLYEGSGATQQGVPPGTISAERIAVLRGRVVTPEGSPIAGVRVSVLDHAEYGSTMTGNDGWFTMVVNGARLNLVYEKADLLTMQRLLDAPWQDYLTAEEVVMIPVDDKVTTVDPASSSTPFQVAQGSEPPGGGEPSTLLFPKGAEATMEGGSAGAGKPIDDLAVRVTEFPPGGPQTLPGTMPGNVGPTYAVEFSVDEARAAGADTVEFSKPLINYTKNFIGAPVGGPVPTAYYDRDSGRWVPSRNGRVIRIASESADGKAVLEGAGGLTIGPDELAQLAQLYDPGDELWRVPIDHFTPWDHNWPYGPPPGAKPPKLKDFEWKDPNDPCNKKGSLIACEAQTLGEEIPLTGTSVTLDYNSSRTPGYKAGERLDIPVTGGQLPPDLKGIQLDIDVAGRHIEKRWCDPSYPTTGQSTCAGFANVAPNLSYDFEWDGKDAFGRAVQGRPVATVRVTYVYEFNYYPSPDDFEESFGQFPEGTDAFNGARYCGNQNPWLDAVSRRYSHFFCGILSRQTIKRAIGAWDVRDVDGLGGMSLSVHHGYDPQEKVVYKGDGTTIRSEPLGSVLATIAGGGSGFPTPTPRPGGDVDIDYLYDVALGPDGSVYGTAGLNQNQIWRMTPDGKLRSIAGKDCESFPPPEAPPCEEEGEPAGDGGPALGAILGTDTIEGLAVGPDGSVYFTVEGNDWPVGYVRKVSPDGTLSTIAGVPWTTQDTAAGANGDGGPAKQAKLSDPRDVAVGPDGSVYLSERRGHTNDNQAVVRKISPTGMISTVAGGGVDNAADDEDLGAGEPATQQELDIIYGLAVAPDGTLYLADPNDKRVQKVAPDGMLTRVAGDGTAGAVEYGKSAVASKMGAPVKVALGPDGTLYVRTNDDDASAGSDVKVVKIDSNGVVQPIAGRNTAPSCFSCLGQDGEAANGANLFSNSIGLEAYPDGSLLVSDGRHQVRRLQSALPGFEPDAVAVPSTDGSEVYVFDSAGRHKRTLDGMTGTVRWDFEYADGRLVAAKDVSGNALRIERAADGTPTAIMAPGGQRTVLGLDGAGRVNAVTNPAGQSTAIGYDAGGLLTAFTEPGSPPSQHAYDALGRLTRAQSPTGDVQTLARSETEDRTTVTLTSGEGRVTTFVTEALPNGDRSRRIARPSGATTTLVVQPDGTRVRTEPDGTKTTTVAAADPRWGMRAPLPARETTETPGGKKIVVDVTRDADLTDPKDPLSVERISTRIVRKDAADDFDGEATEITYMASDRTIQTESPERRQSLTTLDALGRVVEVQPDINFDTSLDPITISYDARGRVQKYAQGAQSWTNAYDEANRLVSRTDAGGAAVQYAYDAADRVTEKRLPGGRVYRYGYSPGGRLQSLTMPNGSVNTFTTDAANRPTAFAPPGSGAGYRREYDRDNALAKLTLPSGAVRDPVFDAGGRETSTAYSGERDDLAYPAGQERPSSLSRTPTGGSAQRLQLTHDGLLPTGYQFTGPASGTYGFEFGPKLRLAKTTLAGAADTAFAYDQDGNVTGYGPFTLTREAAGGAVDSIGDGTLAATYGYDGLGRLADRRLAVGATTKYRAQVLYDARGRVRQRTETVDGTPTTLTYEYDDNGELLAVKQGTAAVESYGYDLNGNRTTPTATYDAADRITKLGTTPYELNADGFMTKRGSDTFLYGSSGDLLSATAGGQAVTYAYDANGRRTARTKSGATEQYLYGDPTNPFKLTASRASGGELTTYYYDTHDALFALERGGVRYYVGSDQVGTPKVVFTAAGAVVLKRSYDAFGRLQSSTGAFALPIGFAGGLEDPDSGLVRFGLRDFDPASGRFTARDPIFFDGSPGNLYAYAGSDPVGKRDPTGLACIGGSFYAGVGGGIQFCRKDGKNSICAEGGVGAGGGVEVDVFGGAASTGTSLVGEVTKKFGPLSGTLGFEMDLDCFNTKGSAKVGALGLGAGVDTDGEFSSSFGGSDADDFNGRGERTPEGKWGVKAEGKLVIKGCGQF